MRSMDGLLSALLSLLMTMGMSRIGQVSGMTMSAAVMVHSSPDFLARNFAARINLSARNGFSVVRLK